MGDFLSVVERDQGGYTLPWGNRFRAFPQRTYCGRVVYDKPRHLFTLRDVERIIEHVTIYTDKPEKNPPFIVSIIKNVWRLIFAIVPVPGILVPLEEPFINWYTGVMEDLKIYQDQQRAFASRTRTLVREIVRAYLKYFGQENSDLEEELEQWQ